MNVTLAVPRNVSLTPFTDFPCTGRFGLLVLTSPDLLDSEGTSAKALNEIDSLLASYPPTLLQLSILHNLRDLIRGIAWNALPAVIHKRAEMRFHSARPGEVPGGQLGAAKLHTLGAEDAYGIYGASREQGLIAVVRPDGYVGMVAALDGVQRVFDYLDSIMVRQR
jgi:phenol 2-monooxygenase